MHVPAASTIGCIGVDDNKAVGISKVSVLSTLEVRLSGTRAVVYGDDKRGRTGKVCRFVEEHANIGRVRPEVGDLLQLPGGSEHAGDGKSESE